MHKHTRGGPRKASLGWQHSQSEAKADTLTHYPEPPNHFINTYYPFRCGPQTSHISIAWGLIRKMASWPHPTQICPTRNFVGQGLHSEFLTSLSGDFDKLVWKLLISPGWCGSVDWAPACELKGPQFWNQKSWRLCCLSLPEPISRDRGLNLYGHFIQMASDLRRW